MPKKTKANKRYRRNRGLKTFKFSSIYQTRKTRNHKYKNKNVRTMKKIYGGDFIFNLIKAEEKDNKRIEKRAREEAQAAEKRAKEEEKAAEKRAREKEKAANAAEKAQRVAENKATRILRRDNNFNAVKLSMRDAIIEARKKTREKESAALTIQKKVRRLLTKRAEAKAKEAEVEAQNQKYEQNFGTSSNTQPNEDTLTKTYRQAYELGYDPTKKIVTHKRTAKIKRRE
jgi:aspartate beta-hydroxylase